MIQQTILATRILTIPKIIFYYLSTFLFPVNLAVGQVWLVRQIDLQNFFLPLLLDIVVLIGSIIYGFFLLKKNKNYFKLYLFFAGWLCVGLILHLQILPLDATVADRYFYFPIIGLLGILGILLSNLKQWIHINRSWHNLFIAFSFLIIISLSIVTIIRNSQWQTIMGLFAHDVKYAQSPLLDSYYGGRLMLNGQFDEAKPYLEQSIEIDPHLGHNYNNLAVYYEHTQNNSKAQDLYSKNIQHNINHLNSYIDVSYAGLAHIALNEKKFKQAKKLAKAALEKNPSNTFAQQYLAIAEYELGEKKEALNTMEKLYNQAPTVENQGLLNLIETNQLPFPVLQNSGDVIY